jgi:L-lactate permease
MTLTLTLPLPILFCVVSFSIFCFAYMVEGASGFGTPTALGAPMLVSMGHPAFESVVVLLIFNTFATVWGSAGTLATQVF